jgi:thymidylate synthase
MEFEHDGLDGVLIDLYDALLNNSGRNVGSRGANRELLGVALRIRKPRARLSRSENRGKPFSALGELLWYLTKSDKLDFIEPYIGQYKNEAVDGVIHGAYGPRLFAMRGIDQLENVTNLLCKNSGSRRAVVQLFNAEDIATSYPEIPCTTTMQFHLRGGHLHLSTTMRSNDAFWGLPHDVFFFTMLQEMLARRLEVELGEYYHYAGSMHIYDDFVENAKAYISEGHQRIIEMPAMPHGNPFSLIPKLLDTEKKLRKGEIFSASSVFSTEYWADIVRLLQVFWEPDTIDRLDILKAELVNPIYRSYLDGRQYMKPRCPKAPVQAQED